jgi:mannitol/fructose-specific phosphotransferase system IIA component (Ntr-type)
MRLTETLKLVNIKVPLTASNKRDAIKEMIDLLSSNSELDDAGAVLEAVMEREGTRTTGIGYGLAIPHGKSDGTKQLIMAVGRTGTPIEFQSIDGKPVTIIWLLVSPRDKAGAHITTLAKISKLMNIDRFRAEMNKAVDAQAVYDLIAQYEVNV